MFNKLPTKYHFPLLTCGDFQSHGDTPSYYISTFGGFSIMNHPFWGSPI